MTTKPGQQLLAKLEGHGDMAKAARAESLALINRCLKNWPSDPSKAQAHIRKTVRRYLRA